LDLDQVTLVDVEVVRFLRNCEAAGIAVLHGPPYIREWSRRVQDRPGQLVREGHWGGTPRTFGEIVLVGREGPTGSWSDENGPVTG
jgi:hypothetical protein